MLLLTIWPTRSTKTGVTDRYFGKLLFSVTTHLCYVRNNLCADKDKCSNQIKSLVFYPNVPQNPVSPTYWSGSICPEAY